MHRVENYGALGCGLLKENMSMCLVNITLCFELKYSYFLILLVITHRWVSSEFILIPLSNHVILRALWIIFILAEW